MPERLLLAHARGEVLFITGAGTSVPSRLPDFKQLVAQAYARLDAPAHAVLSVEKSLRVGSSGLTSKQDAEINRFDLGDFDVAIGMLERRIDGVASPTGKVRRCVSDLLSMATDANGNPCVPRPAAIHKALMRLADRGVATTIATTNFDRLLQAACRTAVPTRALSSIPRPSLGEEFSGVLHIHGAMGVSAADAFDMVISDRDFGEYYFRRNVITDFIYDAARLFNLVLVGYRASDAPMRYLLNAIAADGSRFRDLRERFAFVPDSTISKVAALDDWKGRGITPIPYQEDNHHAQLERSLSRWAELSSWNGNPKKIDLLISKLSRQERARTPEGARDLFDHLVRRGTPNDRYRWAQLLSGTQADLSWMDAMNDVASEKDSEGVR